MTTRLTLFLFSALLAGTAGAAAGDKTDVVRDLAGRVGPIVGSASACRDIARPRIQVITDKFTAVITEAAISHRLPLPPLLPPPLPRRQPQRSPSPAAPRSAA